MIVCWTFGKVLEFGDGGLFGIETYLIGMGEVFA